MYRLLVIVLGISVLLTANEQKSIQIINNGEEKTLPADSSMIIINDSLNVIDNLFRDQIDES